MPISRLFYLSVLFSPLSMVELYVISAKLSIILKQINVFIDLLFYINNTVGFAQNDMSGICFIDF